MAAGRQCGVRVRFLLYLLLVICCTLVLAVQSWYLVLQYLEEPVAIDMDILSGVAEAPFPDLTVCDSNQFSRRVARAWGALNNNGLAVKWNRFPWNGNRSVTEFSEEAAPPLDQLVQMCNGKDCKPMDARGGETPKGNWTAGWFRRGFCYTFHPSGMLIRNRKRSLHLELHSDLNDSTLEGAKKEMLPSSVQLFFHSSAVTPIVDSDFDDAEMTTDLTIQAGQVVQLRVSARQRRLQPLRRRPCDASARYSKSRCLVQCRWRAWAHAIGCRPPWSDAFSLPLCSSKKEFLRMKTKNLKLPEDDPCPASCPPACLTTLYQLQVTEANVKEHMLCRSRSIVNIVWPYTTDLTSERLSYSASDLMSDLGGSLGLLLGLSVLSIVQLAETAIRSMFSRCRRHRHIHILLRSRQKPAPTRPVLDSNAIITVVSETKGRNVEAEGKAKSTEDQDTADY